MHSSRLLRRCRTYQQRARSGEGVNCPFSGSKEPQLQTDGLALPFLPRPLPVLVGLTSRSPLFAGRTEAGWALGAPM